MRLGASLEILIANLRAWAPPEPHDEIALAAVATIVRPGKDSPEILFIERAMRDGDPWSGDIAFPGGKREHFDASLLITAMRETREEIGLHLEESSFVVRLGDVLGLVNSYRVSQFVFVVTEENSLAVTPEVASFFWVPMTELTDPKLVETVRLERGGHSFEVPCIRLGRHILWGMTFRMTGALASAMGL
jgi:8-oxo-dGTP pyrophosphatase MutT (NUDIX family)